MTTHIIEKWEAYLYCMLTIYVQTDQPAHRSCCSLSAKYYSLLVNNNQLIENNIIGLIESVHESKWEVPQF